eukprot:g2297.t1
MPMMAIVVAVLLLLRVVVSTPAVTRFVLVDGMGAQLRTLLPNSTVDLAQDGTSLGVLVETTQDTKMVRFIEENNNVLFLDQTAPFQLQKDKWLPWLGEHRVLATPFADLEGNIAGSVQEVTFKVVNSLSIPDGDGGVEISGELKIWHKVTFTCAGKWSHEGAVVNPFTDCDIVQGAVVNPFTDCDIGAVVNPFTDCDIVQGAEGAVVNPFTHCDDIVQGAVVNPFTDCDIVQGAGAVVNPFTDYRLQIEVMHNGGCEGLPILRYILPGYFAADGQAANTSASAGNKWRVHFMPDREGVWIYSVSFRQGLRVALDSDRSAGTAWSPLDGRTGTISVGPSDKTGSDFRARGRLKYVQQPLLWLQQEQTYFIKAGAGGPANLLAYSDFDGQFKHDGLNDALVKNWSAHVTDWNTGDPSWQGGKGKGLIGALNYLSSKGVNAFSFLTLTIGGEDGNVFPYLESSSHDRMDVSRLEQWEVVFAHAQSKGLSMTLKTQERVNSALLDQGELGTHRLLYYRELVARFSHHPALSWSLGQDSNNTAQQLTQFAAWFSQHDPYRSPMLLHTLPDEQTQRYSPLLGAASQLNGASLHSDQSKVQLDTKSWRTTADGTGRPWAVTSDQQVGGVLPDAQATSVSEEQVRGRVLYGNLLSGGAGVEYSFGTGSSEHGDWTCQNWTSRARVWTQAKHALDLFASLNVSLNQLRSYDELTPAYGDDRVLALPGVVYVVYVPSNIPLAFSPLQLNLGDQPNTAQYSLQWYNPRNGGYHNNIELFTAGVSKTLTKPISGAGAAHCPVCNCSNCSEPVPLQQQAEDIMSCLMDQPHHIWKAALGALGLLLLGFLVGRYCTCPRRYDRKFSNLEPMGSVVNLSASDRDLYPNSPSTTAQGLQLSETGKRSLLSARSGAEEVQGSGMFHREVSPASPGTRSFIHTNSGKALRQNRGQIVPIILRESNREGDEESDVEQGNGNPDGAMALRREFGSNELGLTAYVEPGQGKNPEKDMYSEEEVARADSRKERGDRAVLFGDGSGRGRGGAKSTGHSRNASEPAPPPPEGGRPESDSEASEGEELHAPLQQVERVQSSYDSLVEQSRPAFPSVSSLVESPLRSPVDAQEYPATPTRMGSVSKAAEVLTPFTPPPLLPASEPPTPATPLSPPALAKSPDTPSTVLTPIDQAIASASVNAATAIGPTVTKTALGTPTAGSQGTGRTSLATPPPPTTPRSPKREMEREKEREREREKTVSSLATKLGNSIPLGTFPPPPGRARAARTKGTAQSETSTSSPSASSGEGQIVHHRKPRMSTQRRSKSKAAFVGHSGQSLIGAAMAQPLTSSHERTSSLSASAEGSDGPPAQTAPAQDKRNGNTRARRVLKSMLAGQRTQTQQPPPEPSQPRTPVRQSKTLDQPRGSTSRGSFPPW